MPADARGSTSGHARPRVAVRPHKDSQPGDGYVIHLAEVHQHPHPGTLGVHCGFKNRTEFAGLNSPAFDQSLRAFWVGYCCVRCYAESTITILPALPPLPAPASPEFQVGS